MIHIDTKITIWERFAIDQEHEEALMEFLANNPKASSNAIYEWAAERGIEGEHSTLVDTGEYLEPEANSGAATVEVLRSSGDWLWDNVGKQPE